jgi:hypothetical protein
MTEKPTPARQLFDAAFALIERADGDIEFARVLWDRAFEEAEELDRIQSLGEMDDWERAVFEQGERFERAIEARKEFRGIP